MAEADLAAVEGYYGAHWPPDRESNVLRHDLKTMLGNFPGEVDRANTWAMNGHKPHAASREPQKSFAQIDREAREAKRHGPEDIQIRKL